MKEQQEVFSHETHTECKKGDNFNHNKESLDRAYEVVDCS